MWGAVVALGAIGGLAACNPAPGEARIAVTGDVAFTADGPDADCPAPGELGDNYATWRWRGEVADQPASVLVTSVGSTDRIDTLLDEVGGRQLYAHDPSATTVDPMITSVTRHDDGTLGVTARLAESLASREVVADLPAAIRCPA